MTWLHWLGAALLFLGSTAAGFALRQELRLRLRLLTAVIDSLNLLRSDIANIALINQVRPGFPQRLQAIFDELAQCHVFTPLYRASQLHTCMPALS